MTSLATQTRKTHTDQLEQLRCEVEALRGQLRQAQRLAAVGTMTAMVAHEFNNLLTPIINYARMARTNPALVGKAIARADEGGSKCQHICRAILGLAAGGASAARDVNVRELVSETLAAMAREPAKDGIELDLDVAPELVVRLRPVEFQQVLLNLLINARLAVLEKPSPRKICVSARRSTAHLVLRVRDTGVGIAPENLQRVFEPFFTTRQASESDTAGHGLGLAICREIVTDLGGQIHLESTLGEGTAFTVRLPC
ncbi:MAG TPA: two-component sensor histidine kinase [Phycisphaerales bacterium]|nr:two-component sensor histidine kinase [Phycisphaerales bacterium]